MGIFRFNQNGVGDNVVFGRRGGKVAYQPSGSFMFTDAAGNPSTLLIANEQGTEIGHAATVEDVNRKLQGLRTKQSVNIYYKDPISDLKAPLVGTYDGVEIKVGMRLLLNNQALPVNNGIYVVTAGNIIEFAPDANTYMEIEGAYVYVTDGSNGEGTGWVLNVEDDSNVNATAGSFAVEVKQFHGQGSVKVALGLALPDGTTITPAFQNFTGLTNSAEYADTFVINKGANHFSVTGEKLFEDLGIASWKIATKDGNHITTSDGRNGTRETIVMGVKSTLTHPGNGSLFQLSASELNVNYTGSSVAGSKGAAIKFKAGDGTAGAGGDISLTGGSGNGVGLPGGDITLTPGTSTDINTDNGIVRINSNNALKLPVGSKADRHEPDACEAGFIRVSTDSVAGIDVVEFYQTQGPTKGWKAVGGGTKLSDLDGDTFISVASDGSADTDVIRFSLGDTTQSDIPKYTTGEVISLSTDGFTFNVPDAINPTADSGGNIKLKAGNGNSGGDILLTSGSSGSVILNSSKDITLNTFDNASGAGGIALRTGNAVTGDAGSITIETGNGTNSSINIGTMSTKLINIGNSINGNNTEVVISGKKAISIGTNISGVEGSRVIKIGDRINTTLTELASHKLEVLGGTTLGGLVNVVASVINIGNDASTTDINIGNASNLTAEAATNVNIISENLVLEAIGSLTIRADNADMSVVVDTNGTGVLKVTNPGYTAAVIAENDIPNRKFVTDALVNATFGGIGKRSIATAFNTAQLVNPIGAVLPNNARVTKITVDVKTPFDAAGLVATVTTVTGANNTLVSNNDIDLTVAGLYIIEYSGSAISSGQASLVFDKLPSSGTKGEIYVSLDFYV